MKGIIDPKLTQKCDPAGTRPLLQCLQTSDLNRSMYWYIQKNYMNPAWTLSTHQNSASEATLASSFPTSRTELTQSLANKENYFKLLRGSSHLSRCHAQVWNILGPSRELVLREQHKLLLSHHGLASTLTHTNPKELSPRLWKLNTRTIYIFSCFHAELICGTTFRRLPESFFHGWPLDSRGPRSAGRGVPPAQPGVRCRKNDAKSKNENRFRKVIWKSFLLSTEPHRKLFKYSPSNLFFFFTQAC